MTRPLPLNTVIHTRRRSFPSRLPLLLLPILVAGADGFITLYGQSDAYWSGDRDYPNEANPPFHWLLRQHPAAFAVGLGACALFYCCLILLLPRPLALWTWLATWTSHAWGVSTWLHTLWPVNGFWQCVLLWLVTSGLAVPCWDWSEHLRRRPNSQK